MNKIFIILLSVFFAHTAFTQSNELISPKRERNVDFSIYENQFQKSALSKSAMNSAIYYDEEKLPHGQEWASAKVLTQRFESIRDERFLTWKEHPETPRRTPWFYPDDGCYARAAISMRNIARSNTPLASKVFAFGNLEVQTQNSPDGDVGWWYHVAPLVEVNGVKYVLDPSIEFDRPLTLKEWLGKMGNPEKIKVAICTSGTYNPGDKCDRISDGVEKFSENLLESDFLKSEWDRMVKLGRENEL